MTFKCKGPDNVLRNIVWKRINNAYVAVITVCNENLYPITTIPPTCDENQTLCSGLCVDLQTDGNNCGACGNNCDEGEECIDGECVDVTLPLVSTDQANVSGFGEITLTGTIISEGSTDVIEYGFVYAVGNELPTLEDTVVIVGDSSFTGEFQIETGIEGDPQYGQYYYFRAYATNSAGTEYGDTLQEMPYICLIQGTKITLADGNQKAIEDVTYEDDLLVWNFDEAKFDKAKPVWIAKKFSMPSYSKIEFTDGTKLGTIDGIGHSIFNLNQNKFTHLNSEDTPINTETYNIFGHNIRIHKVKTINEKIEFYNIITHTHMNVFANGILTSSTLNNIYPIENMKFVKENSIERNEEKFDVSSEMFEGLRLAEQPKNYPNLAKKIQTMGKNKL